MHRYDAKSIRKHTWPTPQQMPDGRWRRVWTIRLAKEPFLATTLEALAAEIAQDVIEYVAADDSRLAYLKQDLVISLQRPESLVVIAALITTEADWPDDVLSAAWRMFADIDRMVGTIHTIDGQARDNWPPFSWQSYQPADASTG